MDALSVINFFYFCYSYFIANGGTGGLLLQAQSEGYEDMGNGIQGPRDQTKPKRVHKGGLSFGEGWGLIRSFGLEYFCISTAFSVMV